MSERENYSFKYEVFYNHKTMMYGICCVDEKGIKTEEIDDITYNRGVIEMFCDMLNSEKIYPCHFYDVYEDFFG